MIAPLSHWATVTWHLNYRCQWSRGRSRTRSVSKVAKPQRLFNLPLVAATGASQHHLFYLSNRGCLCNAQLFTLTVCLRVFHRGSKRQVSTIVPSSVKCIFFSFTRQYKLKGWQFDFKVFDMRACLSDSNKNEPFSTHMLRRLVS